MARTGPLAALLVFAAACASFAADGEPDPLALLRSPDALVRADALRALAGEPASYLAPRRAALHAIVPRLVARDAAPAVRAAAARVLARSEGDAAIDPLLDAMKAERHGDVERALAEAFAELPGDVARRALARLASASDVRAAALAAEALGHLPKGGGFDDLSTLLDAAPEWPVAAGACLGLGRIEEVRVVPVLLPRLRHPDPAVRAAARESLVRLTAEDLGTDPSKWELWWDGAHAGFQLPDKGPEGPSMRRGGTADRPMGDGDATFARFFGVELRRRRTAFVIDYSQSMWGPRRERAEAELTAAVKGLPSTHAFTVVLFNEKVWTFGGGPLPARPQEKFDLVRYLVTQETKSYTNIYDALETAFGLAGLGPAARVPAPGLDEVVLLSDGVPNRGKITEPAKILEALRALNSRRLPIHTVALGEGPGELLPAIAKESGGKFVACPFAK